MLYSVHCCMCFCNTSAIFCCYTVPVLVTSNSSFQFNWLRCNSRPISSWRQEIYTCYLPKANISSWWSLLYKDLFNCAHFLSTLSATLNAWPNMSCIVKHHRQTKSFLHRISNEVFHISPTSVFQCWFFLEHTCNDWLPYIRIHNLHNM